MMLTAEQASPGTVATSPIGTAVSQCRDRPSLTWPKRFANKVSVPSPRAMSYASNGPGVAVVPRS
eukprot:scaffold121252_cov36-Tisochrysis_lutea.AAC.3